ncbi:MAG TPA: caspase family protein [Bacteroidales bacterium]|nr:caspase family protein [Bacteroidales bacterium]HPF01685.1 caspase family protein [Bacteroidales bacterium]HPJ58694.1 caspase family protein [Bacteroidales bacterium]HRW84601.1 caspase family protein [Bacteroidales bacterium]
MISFRKISPVSLLLAFTFSSVFCQKGVSILSEEKNLGEIIAIQVLTPVLKEALSDEGYIFNGDTGSGHMTVGLKVSTRTGSESMGIYTSFADVLVTVSSQGSNKSEEKTFTGIRGAGLGFDHAGIDAIQKSAAKVIPEIIRMLKELMKNQPEDQLVSVARPAGNDSKDLTPPEINIVSPVLNRNNYASTRNPGIVIEGFVHDESGLSGLYINDQSVELNESGHFVFRMDLEKGITRISVTADDVFNNRKGILFSVLRSDSPEPLEGEHSGPGSAVGKYFALLIAVNEYKDPGIVSLDNPVSDAEGLYSTITTFYSFDPQNIIFLKNPDRSEIIIAFDEISKKITRDDNLLIFYAGHGLWDNKKRLGYWLPADAGRSNTAFWIYNSTIQDLIKSIPARHTLLIADACFSGSIFKTRKAFSDAPQSIEKLYDLPSRKAMTSGMMTEVPDKSVFLEYLNRRLRENTETYLSSQDLFTSFREAVLNNSPNTPQYGIIQDTGDEGGDFIFVRKSR